MIADELERIWQETPVAYPVIWMEGLKTSVENLNSNSQCPSLHRKQDIPEYEPAPSVIRFQILTAYAHAPMMYTCSHPARHWSSGIAIRILF
jgi:hypothetical protein